MNPLVAETVEALRSVGWRTSIATPPQPMPKHVLDRYPDIPPLALDFFTNVEECESPSGGWWFLTAADYTKPAHPDGYAWNSFEDIVNADTDPAARAWWDRHLILFQLVSGDYQFLALCLDSSSPNYGKVVGAELVDFDASTPLADSYEDLLIQLRDVARRPPTRANVYDNYLTLFVHEEIIEDGSTPPWERGLLAKLRRWWRGW